MKCEICKLGPPEQAMAVYRVNPIGELPGIFRCHMCLTPEQRAKIHPEVREIVGILEGGEPKLLKCGSDLIAEERVRQIGAEGWTKEHDDGHIRAELVVAANGYAAAAAIQIRYPEQPFPKDFVPPAWPWDDAWFKLSKDPIRNLVKAGALIAAEIDRLTRFEIAYRAWYEELKKVAVEKFEFTPASAETICYDSWKSYFMDGNTPEEAMREDLSNA